VTLLEYGAGAGVKTELLIEALRWNEADAAIEMHLLSSVDQRRHRMFTP
jgi:hypothetical protein